ncbi:MAG TPA: K(+)-transporting ATPase subunit C [Desulfomonilaceae bacterium]|nr:K(+)-transporting ATPase subunit C [Desulfomonilaceae bacterium]
MNHIVGQIRVALVATVLLGLIVCGIYPLAVWGIAQGLFPFRANGSLIEKDGKAIGSELIAQNFTDPKYFHPRPSSAGEAGYDASNSGGSNLGPLSKKLVDSVEKRVELYRTENGLQPTTPIPPDAVTASASGLDPDISVENARLQAARVARARGLSQEAVMKEISAHTAARDLGVFGEPRVNVLLLNLALDAK